MNEQTISQDRLAEEIERAAGPLSRSHEPQRLPQSLPYRHPYFAVSACKSGLVPCIHTGKRTRCYKIAKANVTAYLCRRLTEPEYYAPPSGWYKNYPQRKPPAVSLTALSITRFVSRLLLRRYLEQQLADAPDV